MRSWQTSEADLNAAGGRLLVLTADDPSILDQVQHSRPWTVDLVPVPFTLWSELGVRNPAKPELPHPSTLVVAPDGEILLWETHVDYKQRTPPEQVVALVAGLDAGPPDLAPEPSAEPAHTPVSHPVDWQSHLELSAEPGRLLLSLDPGFHLYGTAEQVGRPLVLRLSDGRELPVPEGTPKDLGALGQAWVLTGELEFTLPEGACAGEAEVQICSETGCSMPTVRQWSCR